MKSVLVIGIVAAAVGFAPAPAAAARDCSGVKVNPVSLPCSKSLTATSAPQAWRWGGRTGPMIAWQFVVNGRRITGSGRAIYGCVYPLRTRLLVARVSFCKGQPLKLIYRARTDADLSFRFTWQTMTKGRR